MDKPVVVPAGLLTAEDIARAQATTGPALTVEQPPRPMIPRLCLYCEHFALSYKDSEPGAGDRALVLRCQKGKFNLAGRQLDGPAQLRQYVHMGQKCEAWEVVQNKGVPSGESFGKGGSLTVIPKATGEAQLPRLASDEIDAYQRSNW